MHKVVVQCAGAHEIGGLERRADRITESKTVEAREAMAGCPRLMGGAD